MTYPTGALTLKDWPEFVEAAKQSGILKFWWVDRAHPNLGATPHILKYSANLITYYKESEWLAEIINEGRIFIFSNYWFAYAYAARMSIISTTPIASSIGGRFFSNYWLAYAYLLQCQNRTLTSQ